MKSIGIIFILMSLALKINAQWPTKTGEIVAKKETVKLLELAVLDSSFLARIDELSVKADHPLNLYDKEEDVIYLNIVQDCQDTISYTIYVSNEKQFIYFEGIWGYFENERKLYILAGTNIPQLFKKTNHSKNFHYFTTLGERMSDGNILPLATEIDDSKIAIEFTYKDGVVQFEKIFEGY